MFGVLQLEASLRAPYDGIEVLPFDPHGWYSNGGSIETLFTKHQPKVVIEVGCWLGASTRHMASLLREGGIIYAVDHWLGSVEHQSSECLLMLPSLYQQFLSNVIHSQLTDKIIPVRMSSLEACRYLRIPADLIYIDASHDTESVYADLKAWFPHVKGHGILCGDDWSWASVAAAVVRFAQENDLKIEAEGNFYRLVE